MTNNHDQPRPYDADAEIPEGEEPEHPPSPLVAENAALHDRLLRALADVDNTRRQAERTASDARKYAIGEFAREILAVSDNLRRTLAAADEDKSGGEAALVEGVRATERILEGVLGRFGLCKVEALGIRFDPHVHEAVMEVADASRPPGSVASVLEDGYTIHDRLVRPARVAVVARRPGP
jgi:molecular chaperone GrpE